MRVLVTRPEADSGALLAELQSRGVEGVVEPLLGVENLPSPPLDFSEIQAIALTSANGARAMVGIEGGRDLPVYAVGEATAAAAREMGFATVDIAGGDVDALSKRIKEKIDPKAGAVLHPAATTVAGDLATDLVEMGYDYRRINIYEAVAASKLSANAVQAIKKGEIDGVVLYSPRTAEIFVSLIRKARAVRAVQGLTAYSLSPAVAEAAQKLDWQEIHVATEPTQAALLRLFDGIESKMPKPEVPVSEKTVIPESEVNSNPDVSAVETEAPSPERVPKNGSRFALFLANLIVIVIVVGVGAATLPIWSPLVSKYYPGGNEPSADAKRITGLMGRISALEAEAAANPPLDVKALDAERVRLQEQLDVTLRRLNTLEDSLGDVRKLVEAAGNASGSADAGALLRLTERLRRLEDGGASAANKQALEAISGQVTKLEKDIDDVRPTDEFRTVPTLLVAVGQLREAVRSSRAYRDELAVVRALAAADTGIAGQLDTLSSSATKGVATQAQLRTRFDQAAGSIVRAELVPDGEGWVDRTISRLTAAVRWRRTDNLEGNGAEAIVARAERKLATADVVGAISELLSLPEKPLAVAQPWLRDAQAHIAAEAAIAALQTKAIAKINAGNRPK